MKMQCMARFLIKGDIILHNRKKYEVVSVSNKEEEVTTIIYKTLKCEIFRILKVAPNVFLKVISPIKL